MLVANFSIMRHASIAAFAAHLSIPSLNNGFVAAAPAFVPITAAARGWRGGQLASSRLFVSSSSSGAAVAPTPVMRYLLVYDYVTNVLDMRGPYRDGHLGLATTMIEEGLCVSGGPTFHPGEKEGVPRGALFVFTTKDAAEAFVTQDPYVSNGIVVSHTISEWNVLLGSGMSSWLTPWTPFHGGSI